MRVLLDCRMATWSGVGRYATGLTRALAARGDLELVQVCEPGPEPPVPAGAGVEVVRASGHPFMPAAGVELGRIVRAAHPDIVHCLHVPTPIPAPHPLVVTIHDLTPLRVPGVMPSKLRRAAYRAWNRRVSRVADAVIADSSFTAADFSREFPRIPVTPRVVPLGVDDFANGPVADVASLGALAPEPYVFSMGNTKPHKDLPTLLRAFASVASSHPGLRLLLVGRDHPGYAASVLGDGPAVRRIAFTGEIDDPVLRALYARASVFAFPSRYEGFGLPPLEAMAFGAPVVCSDAASLPEVVGEAALVFRAGDADALASAMRVALDDDAERVRLIEAGMRRAAGFAWSVTAETMVEVYRSLL